MFSTARMFKGQFQSRCTLTISYENYIKHFEECNNSVKDGCECQGAKYKEQISLLEDKIQKLEVKSANQEMTLVGQKEDIQIYLAKINQCEERLFRLESAIEKMILDKSRNSSKESDSRNIRGGFRGDNRGSRGHRAGFRGGDRDDLRGHSFGRGINRDRGGFRPEERFNESEEIGGFRYGESGGFRGGYNRVGHKGNERGGFGIKDDSEQKRDQKTRPKFSNMFDALYASQI
eukprot:403344288